jgi:hypothetical protein
MMFVPKYYEMDPVIEDLLFDGSYLLDGMIVLVGDPRFRVDLTEEMTPDHAEAAKRFNRWCSVTNLIVGHEYIAFLATYEDGTKRKVVLDRRWPWLVKLNSLPPRDLLPREEAQFDAFATTPPRHSDPAENQTAVFRFNQGQAPVIPGEDPAWVDDAEQRWRDEKGTTTQP